MGIRYSKPPVLMHDVIDDLDAVAQLLKSQAPYTPLGGWYNPGADPTKRTRGWRVSPFLQVNGFTEIGGETRFRRK